MAGPLFALDTNVLVYYVDVDDPNRHARAREVVRRAAGTGRCVLTVQALGEFYAASTKRRRTAPALAAARLRDWMALFPILAADAEAVLVALEEAAAGRFSYWDALMLATLDAAGAVALISEDMGDGAMLGAVRVLNPFRGERLPEPVRAILGSA